METTELTIIRTLGGASCQFKRRDRQPMTQADADYIDGLLRCAEELPDSLTEDDFSAYLVMELLTVGESFITII